MIFAVSAFENPRLRRKSVRSSPDRATICARAARMPDRNPAADASAKLSSAGAASAAKREAAYLEWRIVKPRTAPRPTAFGSDRPHAGRSLQIPSVRLPTSEFQA